MKVYILKAYSDEHMWHGTEEIIGVFTNRKALYRAIMTHAADLGLENGNKYAFDKDFFLGYCGDNYLYTGTIEVYTANEDMTLW